MLTWNKTKSFEFWVSWALVRFIFSHNLAVQNHFEILRSKRQVRIIKNVVNTWFANSRVLKLSYTLLLTATTISFSDFFFFSFLADVYLEGRLGGPLQAVLQKSKLCRMVQSSSQGSLTKASGEILTNNLYF